MKKIQSNFFLLLGFSIFSSIIGPISLGIIAEELVMLTLFSFPVDVTFMTLGVIGILLSLIISGWLGVIIPSIKEKPRKATLFFTTFILSLIIQAIDISIRAIRVIGFMSSEGYFSVLPPF